MTLEDFVSRNDEANAHANRITPEISDAKSGFVIDELELQGFMRYLSKNIITIPYGLTVITGRTGAGKTSILDGMTFALYKRTSRTDLQNVKIEDICRPGGYVKLKFKQGSDSYELTRGLARNGSSYLYLKLNGRDITGNIQELDKKIEEIIGLDYVGFRNSTFIRQEEMKALGSESGAERLDILQKLFRFEIFEKAQGIASEKLESIEEESDRIEISIKEKERLLTRLPDKEKELKKINDLLELNRKEVEDIENILKIQKQDLEKCKAKHDEYVKTCSELELVNERLKKDELELSEIRKKSELAKALEKKLTTLHNKVKNQDTIKSEIDRLEKIELQVKKFQEQKEIFSEQKQKLEHRYELENAERLEEIEGLEERVAKLSTTLDKDVAFGILRKEGALEERLIRIEKELNWLSDRENLVKKLKHELIETEKSLGEVRAKTSEINVDSFLLSELKTRKENLSSKLIKIETEYSEEKEKMVAKINQIEKNICKFGFDDEKMKKLEALKIELADMEKTRTEIDDIEAKLKETGDAQKLIDKFKTDIIQNNKRKEELQAILEILLTEERSYKILDEEFVRNQEKLIRKKEEQKEKEGMREMLRRELEELHVLKDEIKNLASKHEELSADAEIYTLLKDHIFHRKGLTMYAISQLLPHLAYRTSEYLTSLTDGRLNKVKLVPYEEKSRYGVRIEVEGPGSEFRDVSEFSGGERTQINAAIRFAIAEELASIVKFGKIQSRMKILFIDEGDLGSLDTEGSREMFVRKLLDMNKFFDKVVLITHLEEVAEKFQNRIQVHMSPEHESFIRGEK